MSLCVKGANTNCPNELPALMTPAALPRASGVRRCATAPMRTEKLHAPAPTAERMPSEKTSPSPLVMKGVSAEPMARTTIPATRTGPVP